MRKTTKIDCHTHTRGSDGYGTPEQFVRYAKRAGLDGICLTDHHKTYTPESLEVASALRAAGIMVIHGCEYSTHQGHLLVYGVNVEDMRLGFYPEMQDVIDEVNRRGGVCVPSHPYKGYKRTLGDRVLRLRGVRAYETVNGQCVYQCPEANKKAATAAQRRHKLGLGGSDAHDPRDIGQAFTEFQGWITCEREFLQALKRGQFRPITSRKARDRYRVWNMDITDLDRNVDSGQILVDGE